MDFKNNTATGIKRSHAPPRMVGDLRNADIAEKQAQADSLCWSDKNQPWQALSPVLANDQWFEIYFPVSSAVAAAPIKGSGLPPVRK